MRKMLKVYNCQMGEKGIRYKREMMTRRIEFYQFKIDKNEKMRIGQIVFVKTSNK